MKRLAIVFVLIMLYSTTSVAHNQISDYQRVFMPVFQENFNRAMIALRTFNMNGIPSYLVVDPSNLQTRVTAIQDTTSRPDADITGTLYFQVLNRYTSAPFPLEYQGLKHIDNLLDSNILTIDLCPSSKPIEHQFFHRLADLAITNGRPTPVTIAISGCWLIKHRAEFNWLVKLKQEQKLDITWANHSYNHSYHKGWPYSHNFLLTPFTNVDKEILLTEQLLLENDELPSVFFRFPGLVSNQKLVETVKSYGLIPLSADAWLANDQAVTDGGIILVHGNGNEHEGILMLMPLLGKLRFLGIREGLLQKMPSLRTQ